MGTDQKIAFVVATKDRPNELRRLWRSLLAQSRLPDEIAVVDASARPSFTPEAEGGHPVLRVIRTAFASAARQRNAGFEAVGPEATLIGFLDDDVVLEPDAVEEMLRFWAAAGPDVAGAALNMVNHPPLDLSLFKRTPFAELLGLYSCRGGTVTASGFQTMIGSVEATAWTDWLPTTASVWRREIFRGHRFDEWYSGYSYLEDLDFSYRVGRAYRLAVVALARYRHLPAPGGRGSGFAFGVREVLNRVHFVRKHDELSLARCYSALIVRLLMSLGGAIRDRDAAFAARAFGNAVGLARSIL